MPISDLDFPCPHCGASLPADAEFCRECGASPDAGWGDDAESYADEEFDYESFVRREFPDQHGRSLSLKTVAIWCIIVLTAISICVTIF